MNFEVFENVVKYCLEEKSMLMEVRYPNTEHNFLQEGLAQVCYKFNFCDIVSCVKCL